VCFSAWQIKHGYRTWRDAIVSNAGFIQQQLSQMSVQHQSDGIHYEDSPFGLALSHDQSANVGIMTSGSGIRIGDGSTGDPMSADEVLARQLQAKEEAKLMAADHKEKTNGNGIPSVILASEEDIADDYPMPKMYDKTEEEMDEFLMADEDVALMDPEFLPQRTLTDFAFFSGNDEDIGVVA